MIKIRLLILITLLQAVLLSGATIHGFVREKDSLEPIISANVWIRGTSIGTATNMKGYFVLASLPPGRYEVVFSYIGYRTEVLNVTVGLSDDTELNVTIQPEAILMEAMEVTADRERRELDIKPGQITVQTPQLRTIPQIAEPDLFRSIQMLPGVATLSDFSAGLYIRGGSPDQNLILLDGIDVYNPNHLFGFFSTFNTDAVKSVELLKGGYPSMYGGRLSSVLNVYNKEGNRDRFHGVARISLLSASTTLEGPWKHGSWMVSGRRTYLELAEKITDFNLPYYFYDGHAKINFDIDRKNQASISFYAGQDRLDLRQDGSAIKLDWGNRTFSAQWTHLFSGRLFSHFLFAGSRFESDSGASFEDMELGIRNDITDLAFKASLTYSPSTRHSMDIGMEAKQLHFDLNYHIVDSDYLNGFRGNYASVFLQDNYKITNLTLLQSGLRFDTYSDGGYFRFDPRISLRHLWTARLDSVFHKPVKWVINTHHHWDHTFGNQAFPGADFIGHKNCLPDMEADYRYPEIRKQQIEAGVRLADHESTRRHMTAVLQESSGRDFRLCPVNRFCADRDTFRAGELSLLFYHTPGIHTRSNITVLIPELGLLFARREFAGPDPFRLEPGAYPQSIARVLKDILDSGTKIQYLLPGHGDPVGNPGLEEAIRYLESRNSEAPVQSMK